MSPYPLLAGAGFIAGAMNAIAGGGSFVTFPALVFVGVPSINANVTSTVALFPGSFASAWAYRREFNTSEGLSVRALLPVSLAGGLVGALLLLFTPVRTFDAVVPWLLLLGTLAFAFGRQAGAALRRVVRLGPATLLVAQFLLAIYGGYFGGAVGLMMMAVWSLFGVRDILSMNAAKTLLVGATNTIAVVCFVVAGTVWWTPALVMLVGGIAGGYGGARLGRRLNPNYTRIGITMVNIAMTVVFFLR
ncbi:MAG: sulfite exporter TauE/SafE family protein [Acetobacteraceae bacterium]